MRASCMTCAVTECSYGVKLWGLMCLLGRGRAVVCGRFVGNERCV